MTKLAIGMIIDIIAGAIAIFEKAFCLLGGGHYGYFMPYNEGETKKTTPCCNNYPSNGLF
ncbi:MAG: hypothetical protein K8S14_10280 [Actinomycetia bacterium]|nr:hypothetical protein [Actinomycetes bacterium]